VPAQTGYTCSLRQHSLDVSAQIGYSAFAWRAGTDWLHLLAKTAFTWRVGNNSAKYISKKNDLSVWKWRQSLHRRYNSCSNESRKGTPEEESLQASLENRHRGCGREVLRQTVPSTGSGNREGPIANGGQLCTTNSQWWWEVECKLSISECATDNCRNKTFQRISCTSTVQKLQQENTKKNLNFKISPQQTFII